ncbi:MAG: hypothetical protein B7Z55_19875, partial [Planctomycetales bacterium 12-60-4]
VEAVTLQVIFVVTAGNAKLPEASVWALNRIWPNPMLSVSTNYFQVSCNSLALQRSPLRQV